MRVEPFFDPQTATMTYVISSEKTGEALIIDPVLDYDLENTVVSYTSANRILEYVAQKNLKILQILETHVHADHLTAAQYLKQKTGARVGIGAGIKTVLAHWVPILKNGADPTGSQFDLLFEDNETFHLGDLSVRVLHTPGHTPACVSYLINDAVFTGDALLMPDVGTARTDFPDGSADVLYDSLQRLLSLPEKTRVFVGHDYPPAGRRPSGESTIQEQLRHNILIHQNTPKNAYVEERNKRDSGKPEPRLITPSLKVNLAAGDWSVLFS